MKNPEKIELPTLTPDEEWIDKVEGVEKTSEQIKRLIYLPAIAYKTAVYAHEKYLSNAQKKSLLLLFRAETDNARGLIDTQISLSVGNSPSDRIGHLKDFESWQKRLLALLQEALDRVSEPFWIEELESLSNDPLLHVNRQEWEEKVKNHLRLFLNVFKKDMYLEKFGEFTYEALKLIRFGSAMMEITMEHPEWIFQAMKNTGFLPANQKYKKPLVNNIKLQKKIERIVSDELKSPVTELKTILEEVKKEASKKEQVSLQEIIEALKNWKKSEETDKDLEEAKQALPSIAITYDILCRSEGKRGAKTKDVIRSIGFTANHGGGYYPALLNDFSDPEVIADLETWQEKQAVSSETRMGKFIKVTIKHLPYFGPYLFDLIYGEDAIKMQKKEKTQRDNKTTTSAPKKQKDGLSKKTIAIYATLVVAILALLFGNNIWGRFIKGFKSNKTVVKQSEPPNLAGNSVEVNNVVYDTRPRVDEIIEEIKKLPPYEQNTAAENYIGRMFKWRLRLENLEPDEDGMVYVVCKTTAERGEVSFNINADAKENLKIKKIKRGKFLDVSGEIEYISLDRETLIMLKDVRLDFID